MSWRKNDVPQNPDPDPNPSERIGSDGSSSEFEEAVIETESPAGSATPGTVDPARPEGPIGEEVIVNLIGKEIALAVAKFPFSQLAVQHPAWMPPDDKLEMLGAHVEAAGNELLEKVLPMAFVKYASMFPATFAMLQAFAGVMMMQYFMVRRLQMEEIRRAAAAQGGNVVTVEAQPVPPVPAPQTKPAPVRPVPVSDPQEVPYVI
jgi:hypothetical protein